eukprot:9175292-Pyramimonas_sp.AAC.3
MNTFTTSMRLSGLPTSLFLKNKKISSPWSASRTCKTNPEFLGLRRVDGSIRGAGAHGNINPRVWAERSRGRSGSSAVVSALERLNSSLRVAVSLSRKHACGVRVDATGEGPAETLLLVGFYSDFGSGPCEQSYGRGHNTGSNVQT